MKILPSKTFLDWFEKTNPHLFCDDKLDAQRLNTEVSDYINDVLVEHMETLEAELSILDPSDDSPDSGFLGGDDERL
jgi:hypothetical protein